MRYLCILVLFLVFTSYGKTQNVKTCKSHEHFEQKLENNPSLRESYLSLQKEIDQHLILNGKELIGDLIIIPVVFHVIHNGDPIGVQENMSDELITAQLQQINDDFSRMNADAGNTPDEFVSIAANTQIQFCLAELDPTGATATGIVRTHIDDLPNVNESDCWTPSYIDANIITPLIWDRDNYLNIFSVIGIDELSNGNCDFFSTLGYAQFPGGSASTDAAVVSFYTFGSIDMPNPLFPNYLGRTCTHEIGHWLNLSHVWGNGNSGCSQDDGIADTPDQFENTGGCPTFPHYDNCTTSGNGIMFMNYMDYSDDNCMNLFTAGQRGMMRAAINSSRASLLTALCSQESVLSILPDFKLYSVESHNETLLKWTFDGAVEVQKFEMERSFDLSSWVKYAEGYDCLVENDVYNCEMLADENAYLAYYKAVAYSTTGEKYESEVVAVYRQDAKMNVSVVPNPSNGNLNFTNLIPELDYTISIYDNLGKLHFRKGIKQSQTFIDISTQPSGLYHIIIKQGLNQQVLRIIKI